MEILFDLIFDFLSDLLSGKILFNNKEGISMSLIILIAILLLFLPQIKLLRHFQI